MPRETITRKNGITRQDGPSEPTDRTTLAKRKSERIALAGVDIRLARSGRLYQRIAAQIEQLVRAQGIGAGERLPAERELAQRLGGSRPSLREAMIALETAGVVEVRIGDGTYVRADRRSHPSPWSARSDPGPGLVEQLEARKLLEPHLAGLAAAQITREEIEALSAAVERAAARFVAGKPAEDDDFFFHVKLAKCSRNMFLAGVVQHLWELRRGEQGAMWRTFRQRVTRPEYRLLALKERRAIVEALRRRDSQAAKRAMRQLLHYLERRLLG